MDDREYRLGDMIDDYCPRCRLLLNHAVASLVGGKVVKVTCLTCHSEHPYREGKMPEKKRPSSRAALFDQVLAKAASAPKLPPEPDLPPDTRAEAEPAKRKRAAAPPARYISRHPGKRGPRGR